MIKSLRDTSPHTSRIGTKGYLAESSLSVTHL